MKKVLIISLTMFAAAFAQAAEERDGDSISVAPPRTFFAGVPAKITVNCPGMSGKSLSWTLSHGGRTMATRRQIVPESEKAEIDAVFPALKPGAPPVDAALSCSYGNASATETLFFFPSNPFFGKTKQLEKLKLTVWMAGEGNELVELLKSMNVPFNTIDNPSEFTGHVLLMNGVDLAGFSGIKSTLATFCANGAGVIVVNPVSGTFALSELKANRITIADNEIIKTFDKKFDAGEMFKRSIRLTAYDQDAAVTFSQEKADPYSFCELTIGSGRMIVCSWNLVQKAKTSPTALFLLEKLITRISEPK